MTVNPLLDFSGLPRYGLIARTRQGQHAFQLLSRRSAAVHRRLIDGRLHLTSSRDQAIARQAGKIEQRIDSHFRVQRQSSPVGIADLAPPPQRPLRMAEARSADITVFSSNIAIVHGPDSARHGSDAGSDSQYALEIHVAGEFSVREPVDGRHR